MTHLHCPRCRLAIRCRADYLRLTNCPRCLARAAITSPLFTSALNATDLHAARAHVDDAPPPPPPAGSRRLPGRPRKARELTAVTDRVVVLARSPQISVAARATVREHADELGPQRTADACLLVSELATNAFKHGIGEIRLRITVRGALARFSIHDDGDGTPRMSLRPGEHGGWGLHLVDRVAARWGVQTAGTLVWFELHDCRPPADPPRLPASSAGYAAAGDSHPSCAPTA